jgi:hypothetical protein
LEKLGHRYACITLVIIVVIARAEAPGVLRRIASRKPHREFSWHSQSSPSGARSGGSSMTLPLNSANWSQGVCISICVRFVPLQRGVVRSLVRSIEKSFDRFVVAQPEIA